MRAKTQPSTTPEKKNTNDVFARAREIALAEVRKKYKGDPKLTEYLKKTEEILDVFEQSKTHVTQQVENIKAGAPKAEMSGFEKFIEKTSDLMKMGFGGGSSALLALILLAIDSYKQAKREKEEAKNLAEKAQQSLQGESSSEASQPVPDHYASLGIDPHATQAEIKAAYDKQLAGVIDEPDYQTAMGQFKELKDAKETLYYDDKPEAKTGTETEDETKEAGVERKETYDKKRESQQRAQQQPVSPQPT